MNYDPIYPKISIFVPDIRLFVKVVILPGT